MGFHPSYISVFTKLRSEFKGKNPVSVEGTKNSETDKELTGWAGDSIAPSVYMGVNKQMYTHPGMLSTKKY